LPTFKKLLRNFGFEFANTVLRQIEKPQIWDYCGETLH